MNCFEWQSQLSEYLDSTLPAATKREADEHLDQCKDCSSRHKQYRIILTSISSQPRSALPVAIRKSPLSAQLPKFDVYGRRSRWERFPWFIRTGIESLGIAFLILLIVATVPRLRTLYEKSVQKRLDAFTLADLSSEAMNDHEAVPISRGEQAATGKDAQDADTGDDFNGEREEEEVIENPNVGSSEIWRFNLRTDSPHELRAKVVQALVDAKLAPETPGIGGTEAPGGIQFDLLVPKDVVTGIMQGLHKLSNQLPKQIAESTETGESFTWYKTKSKTKTIPAGKARVVIWLSQI